MDDQKLAHMDFLQVIAAAMVSSSIEAKVKLTTVHSHSCSKFFLVSKCVQ